MSGHGVIGAATIALERGLIVTDGETLTFDTVAGTVHVQCPRAGAGRAPSGGLGRLHQRPLVCREPGPGGAPRHARGACGRGVRRPLLRYRGHRGDRDPARCGAAARAAAAWGGDPPRRRRRRHRASRRSRAVGGRRRDLHGSTARPGGPSPERDGVRQRHGRPLAVRDRHFRGDGRARRDGFAAGATRSSYTRASSARCFADASCGGRRSASSRPSCRRSRAPPGSPASTPSTLTTTIRSTMVSGYRR